MDREEIECLELLSFSSFRHKILTLLQHCETFALFLTNKEDADYFSDVFIAGSVGEGIVGVPFIMQKQTDIDIMLTLKSFLAVERHYSGMCPDYDILKVENSNLLPGYCLLRKLNSNLSASFFSVADMKSHFEESSISNVISNCFGTVLNSYSMIHGPAFMTHIDYNDSVKSPLGYFESMDMVFGIHCNEWPSVADEWIERNREYNWPSANQIADIVEMGCDFVPVGIPGSESENLEWRVSFVRAERNLVHTMNSAQLKTLCLLKVLFKGKVFGEFFHQKITSYVAKTTLLWISEEQNATEWSENLCLEYLWICLRRIMTCVIDGHCSNYFIRDCNLLHGKINDHEKENLNHPLEEFTRREHFKDNVRGLPVFSGMRGTLLGLLPLVRGILENECMKSFLSKFMNRCLEELIGNLMFCFVSTSQNSDWRKSVVELRRLLRMLKRNRLRFVESSLSDFLIRLLSCAQIRLMNVAICRNNLSHDGVFLIINKLLTTANLRVETLCVSEITQIAHLFFTNELYENTLYTIAPMLEAFKNNPYIRVGNIHSFHRLVSYFLLDMDNVSYTSTRRPISNITFFNLEESILTKHLRIEIISSVVEREQFIGPPLMKQFNVTVSPLVYAYYMKYKCYRYRGNNIESCQVLRELEKQVLHEQSHQYHGLNLLGCSFYESGYMEEAMKAFALAFKQRNSRRSTLYHTAILLKKCFQDH